MVFNPAFACNLHRANNFAEARGEQLHLGTYAEGEVVSASPSIEGESAIVECVVPFRKKRVIRYFLS